MKKLFHFLALVAIVAFGPGAGFVRADDATPKYTVEEIMKAAFKGDDSIAKRITKGKSTKEDYDKLVEYVTSLPLNDAPQGDAVGWKKKTTAVLDAANALKEGKPGAVAQFNQAANCQACHSVYRPE